MEVHDLDVKEPDAIINYQGTYAENRIEFDENGNVKKKSSFVKNLLIILFLVTFIFPLISFLFMFGLISVFTESDSVLFAVLKYVQLWIVGFTLFFMASFFIRKKGIYLVLFIISFGILVVPRLFITVKDYGTYEPITLMKQEIPTINNTSDPIKTAFSFKYKGHINHGYKGELVSVLFTNGIDNWTINDYAAFMEDMGYKAEAIRADEFTVEITKYHKENNVAEIIEVSANYITYMTVKMNQEEFQNFVIINSDR